MTIILSFSKIMFTPCWLVCVFVRTIIQIVMNAQISGRGKKEFIKVSKCYTTELLYVVILCRLKMQDMKMTDQSARLENECSSYLW